MKSSQIIKMILFAVVYGANLLFALGLYLCGLRGDIMLGIILIVFYRWSLWLAPIAVTIICWLPFKPKQPLSKRLIFYIIHLLCCGMLFLTSYLLFGNWY